MVSVTPSLRHRPCDTFTKDESYFLGGFTLGRMHYAKEGKSLDQKNCEQIYRYGAVEVHTVYMYKNFFPIKLIILEAPDVKTARGIAVGDNAEEIIAKYGNPRIAEFGNLFLYEYGSIDNPEIVLRFAVRKDSHTVDYISLRELNIWKRIFPR